MDAGSDGELQSKRAAAARARRLAQGLGGQNDRARLLAFAAELEAEADRRQRRMDQPAAPPVQQAQVQQAQVQALPSRSISDDGQAPGTGIEPLAR
jgi:hypothetical protein